MIDPAQTFMHETALALIERHRRSQAELRVALGEIEKGMRHFDMPPGSPMIETTAAYRQHIEADINKFQLLIEAWKRRL